MASSDGDRNREDQTPFCKARLDLLQQLATLPLTCLLSRSLGPEGLHCLQRCSDAQARNCFLSLAEGFQVRTAQAWLFAASAFQTQANPLLVPQSFRFGKCSRGLLQRNVWLQRAAGQWKLRHRSEECWRHLPGATALLRRLSTCTHGMGFSPNTCMHPHPAVRRNVCRHFIEFADPARCNNLAKLMCWDGSTSHKTRPMSVWAWPGIMSAEPTQDASTTVRVAVFGEDRILAHNMHMHGTKHHLMIFDSNRP